jgi:cytochrome c-type biogenesis protein CcmF
MVLAHMGVAAFVIGVTMVKSYEVEKDLVMKQGQTVEIGQGWRLTFIGVDRVNGPNYVAQHGVFELTEGGGQVIYLLEPQKRMYQAGRQVMTEASINYGVFRDIYVSLGDPVENKPTDSVADLSWGVRVYMKPFMIWVWLACVMMALGGFVTVLDKRYRLRRAQSAQLAQSAAAQGDASAAARAGAAGA